MRSETGTIYDWAYSNTMNANLLNRVAVILSCIGIYVTGVLSISHHTGSALSCGPGAGCGKVAEYVRDHWNNFPVADLGVAAFSLLAVLAILRVFFGMNKTVKPAFLLSAVAVVAHLGLTIFSLTVIGSKCDWCLGAFAVMALNCLTHYFLSKKASEITPTENVVPDACLVVACGLGVAIFLGQQFTPNMNLAVLDGKKIADLQSKTPHRMGSDDAPVKIVEFFDLMCPHCERTYYTAKIVMDQNPNKISWDFRHFPVNAGGVKYSRQAALISEMAADEGKFFQYVDRVFKVDPRQINLDVLISLAGEIGISTSKIIDRLKDNKDPAYTRLAEDIELTGQLGLRIAPSIFVGKADSAVTIVNSASLEEVLKRQFGLSITMPDITPMLTNIDLGGGAGGGEHSEGDGHNH